MPTRSIVKDFHARREALLAVDEAVAAVVDVLSVTGELDSTYVMFTSDNGFLPGEHRVPKGKYLAYDASTHVPLLVRGPGIPAGTVSDELIVNADLAPSVLDATGVSPDITVDGRSLLPFARDGLLRSTRPVLHEGLRRGAIDRDTPDVEPVAGGHAGAYYAIRTYRYLYVMWRGGDRELYDLALDPFELRSLHTNPRYADVRRQLQAELRRLKNCAGVDCSFEAAPLPPPRAARPRAIPRRITRGLAEPDAFRSSKRRR